MRLTKRELFNLPVETVSGTPLGKVSDITVEAEGHTVVQYAVKSHRLVPGLFEQTYLIAPRQVVSLTNEKMVVDENVTAEPGQARAAGAREKPIVVPTRG